MEWAFPKRADRPPWVFVSVGKYWKGVYVHFRHGTLRAFLWGADWRKNTWWHMSRQTCSPQGKK